MKNSFLNLMKKYDMSFFGAVFAIFLIGIINLYSATSLKPLASGWYIYQIQIVYFLIAVLAGFLVSMIHPKNYFRYSYAIYGGTLCLLILVLLMGKKGMGAQRWLVLGPLRLQPSELMKIALVMALSRWFTLNSPERPLTLKDLLWPTLIVGAPALLIMKQPDLGTGLLLILIFSVIVFYRRITVKSISILAATVILISPIVYKYGLKEYQKKRILTFVNPSSDVRGSSYNATQSRIAIGSGKIFGKGFKKSSQASLKFLPENHTDFVFSVFNEEHGFFGAIVVIGLFITLFLRIVWLSGVVLKFYESILVVGLMSIFFWHTFINMCMVIGLMPVVGLPLPFMSYGGSSLLTFGICTGMITSVSNTRNLF